MQYTFFGHNILIFNLFVISICELYIYIHIFKYFMLYYNLLCKN